MLLSITTHAENCTPEFKFGDRVKVIGLENSEDFPDFHRGNTGLVIGKWNSHKKGVMYNVCLLVNNVTCVTTTAYPPSSLKKLKSIK